MNNYGSNIIAPKMNGFVPHKHPIQQQQVPAPLQQQQAQRVEQQDSRDVNMSINHPSVDTGMVVEHRRVEDTHNGDNGEEILSQEPNESQMMASQGHSSQNEQSQSNTNTLMEENPARGRYNVTTPESTDNEENEENEESANQRPPSGFTVCLTGIENVKHSFD